MADRPSILRARIKRQTRLGEMFRLYRSVRGLSLRDVATQIGIGPATLMRSGVVSYSGLTILAGLCGGPLSEMSQIGGGGGCSSSVSAIAGGATMTDPLYHQAHNRMTFISDSDWRVAFYAPDVTVEIAIAKVDLPQVAEGFAAWLTSRGIPFTRTEKRGEQ